MDKIFGNGQSFNKEFFTEFDTGKGIMLIKRDDIDRFRKEFPNGKEIK